MARVAPASGEAVEPAPRHKWTPKQRLEILLASQGRCYLCREKITADDKWDVEHPIQHFLGVPERQEDMRPAHKRCHDPKTYGEDIPRAAKTKRQMKLRLDVERTVSPSWGRSRGFGPPKRIPAKRRAT